MSTLAIIGTLFGTGLILYIVVANLFDAAVFRSVVGRGDPLLNILTQGRNPRRAFVLNVVRPALLTFNIFGGGLLVMGLLDLSIWANLASGVWFFFLTQHACLIGRRASLNQAGWAMVITSAALIAVFVLVTLAPKPRRNAVT